MRINRELSQFMDLARWLSALLVVVTHVNNRMSILLGGLQNPSIVELGWGFICGFAHHAVVVFFTLSGFLVGGKVLQDIGHFEAKKYVSDRVVRIYLVLVPVLVLGGLLDSIGARLIGPPAYGQDVKLSVVGLVGTLLNFQGIFSPTFGTNRPLGTLANEFWYYMTFPLLLAPWMRMPKVKRVVLCTLGIALLTVQTVMLPEHGAGFVLWLIGAAAAAVKFRWKGFRPSVAVTALVLGLVLFRLGVRGSELTFLTRSLSDVAVALGFGLVLYCLRMRPWALSIPRQSKGFADFSYSLYAVHVPVITLYAASLHHFTGFGWHTRATSAWQGAAVAGAVALAVGSAYLLSLVTERNTPYVRGVVRRWLAVEVDSPVGTDSPSVAAPMTHRGVLMPESGARGVDSVGRC